MKIRFLALMIAMCLVATSTVRADEPAAKDAAAATESMENKAADEATDAAADKTSAYPELMDKVSYSIAVQLAQEFQKAGYELNPEVFAQAMKDVYSNTPLKLSESERTVAMSDFQKKMMAEQQSKMAAAREDMKKKASAGLEDAKTFLADNAKKEGVKTTDSGLQYMVIKEGDGASPKATDKVKVHYTGKLADGTVFDSSVERGEPLTIGVNQVIDGWQEALQMMKVGSKWRLFIPPDLGYGEMGSPPTIPPNALLIFDVELISIEDAAQKAPDAQ